MQVGANAEGRIGQKKEPQSMDQVLEVLVRKDRVDAEEAQRALMAATNGIAGCLLMSGRLRSAADSYRCVLVTASRNVGFCEVDRLQQLHAMTNLRELLAPVCFACNH